MGRRDQIVEVASRLLEEQGPEAVTMRAIATELGIKAPSLYKHVSDKGELELALMADGLDQTARVLADAVAQGSDPAFDIARAYRAWALTHPHLYKLMTDKPLPRDLLPPGLEQRAMAPVLEAFGGDVDRARAAWAFAHGMVTLEIAGRFPADADLEAAWAVGVEGVR